MREARQFAFVKVSLACGLWVASAGLLAACHWLGRGDESCRKPAVYATAQDLPPLKVPSGLKQPDTSQALRVPQLKEPAPPPRKKGEPLTVLQFLPASGARIRAIFLEIPILACKSPLRAFLPQNVILLRGQYPMPFLV